MSMIELFTFPAPNALKVLIFLEESGLPYRLRHVDIRTGEQFAESFLAVSPNNKIPALIDHDASGEGGAMAVFESGAILSYLAEKTGQFMPAETAARTGTIQWLFWQAANQGPKFGENSHFRRLESEGDLSYPRERFGKEVRRIYGVMERQLTRQAHIAGEEYSVADMMSYPWASLWGLNDIRPDEFTSVARWVEAIGSRPAVIRAVQINAMPDV
jgi:GST-like protein